MSTEEQETPSLNSARFEEVRVDLEEPLGGMDSLSAVIGIPEWWPTGTRVAVVIAHGDGDMHDPLVTALHTNLANSRFYTVRFNFPFAEANTAADQMSPEILDKAFRAVLSVLGRDPTAAPSQVFLGGTGLGALAAARLATTRFPVDGLFFLGYPLHPAGRPEASEVDLLYRLIPSMLFVQGTEDPNCNLPSLRRCLARVGTPSALRIIEGADDSLLRADADDHPAAQEAGYKAVSRVVERWLESLLDQP